MLQDDMSVWVQVHGCGCFLRAWWPVRGPRMGTRPSWVYIARAASWEACRGGTLPSMAVFSDLSVIRPAVAAAADMSGGRTGLARSSFVTGRRVRVQCAVGGG